ncbi:hypothetical protein M5K25_024486 [Dendrobium thyrsiflorum]|uniref:Uncharacterized protein n=1 Tax=Dendrobium thyrsiflorum TaxID=117978 RepID=A0ABD0U238_DENTH
MVIPANLHPRSSNCVIVSLEGSFVKEDFEAKDCRLLHWIEEYSIIVVIAHILDNMSCRDERKVPLIIFVLGGEDSVKVSWVTSPICWSTRKTFLNL